MSSSEVSVRFICPNTGRATVPRIGKLVTFESRDIATGKLLKRRHVTRLMCTCCPTNDAGILSTDQGDDGCMKVIE